MIVIRVELWHGGNPNNRVDLGTAIISNVSDLADHSDYQVELLKGEAYSSEPGTLYKSGVVRGYPRKDKRWGPWELLALALEATVGDRIEGLKRYLKAPQGTRGVSSAEILKARRDEHVKLVCPFDAQQCDYPSCLAKGTAAYDERCAASARRESGA